jgi:hypothetical protein
LQDNNKLLQQVVSYKLLQVCEVNKLVASLLQVCNNLSISLKQALSTQLDISLLEQSHSMFAAGLSQLTSVFLHVLIPDQEFYSN